MAEPTIWWILAGVAVVAELLTGTFYLLMLSLGLAAGALSAHAGVSSVAQLLIAAAVGGGTVTGWRIVRSQRTRPLSASENRDVNMDVGETVQVDAWNPDGTAGVKYRGAHWTVMPRPGQQPSAGAHTVVEVVGSKLIVEKK
ncbi:MAG: NfeD family protein [Betaproteobacteria bacterium]